MGPDGIFVAQFPVRVSAMLNREYDVSIDWNVRRQLLQMSGLLRRTHSAWVPSSILRSIWSSDWVLSGSISLPRNSMFPPDDHPTALATRKGRAGLLLQLAVAVPCSYSSPVHPPVLSSAFAGTRNSKRGTGGRQRASASTCLLGLRTSSPPQFGQRDWNQRVQVPQRSQRGFISSMIRSLLRRKFENASPVRRSVSRM
jgi:hypothetical protein